MLPGFYPPRAGELKRFISEGLVVLDTNGCWPTSTATSSPHGACLWCGRALPPSTVGRPRRYCSDNHRQHGCQARKRHAERLRRTGSDPDRAP